MTKVFVTNYHISVNQTLVHDLHAIGLEVVMPTQEFASGRIHFFAPNNEHAGIARMVGPAEFAAMEPMVMLVPCTQLVEDFMRIWEARGRQDVLMLLTANSDHEPAWRTVPADFILSHDLTYHRKRPGKFRILYFNRPTILRAKKTAHELRKSFEERKVKLYINNLEGEQHDGLKPEYDAAVEMRELWQERTGFRMPLFGYGNADGWPSMEMTQNHVVDSMFTFVSKRRETWGQLINESMQLGTPCLFLRSLLNSTFTEYLINDDTAILGDTVEELVDKALSLDWDAYQTLVEEAYSQSQMFCNDDIRRDKLRWLFDKAEQAVLSQREDVTLDQQEAGIAPARD
jgi:hypothetical protein